MTAKLGGVGTLNALSVVLCWFLCASCSTEVSRVVVSGRLTSATAPAAGKSDYQRVVTVCSKVALQRNLQPNFNPADTPDLKVFAAPSVLVGFHDPSVAIAPAQQPDVATVTIRDKGDNRNRRAITSDVVQALIHEFGPTRVRSSQTKWTDF